MLKAKVGIRNLGPHLRNCAIWRTTKSIADLRTKKSCGNWEFDFLNSATLHSLLPFPLLSTKDIFRTVCFSRNQKLALKGQQHEIFYLQYFFHESTGFHSQKYAERCGSEALKLRTSGKIVRNSRVAVAEQHFFKKLRNCDYRSASFKLQNCNCRLKKSCACPPLVKSINVYILSNR